MNGITVTIYKVSNGWYITRDNNGEHLSYLQKANTETTPVDFSDKNLCEALEFFTTKNDTETSEGKDETGETSGEQMVTITIVYPNEKKDFQVPKNTTWAEARKMHKAFVEDRIIFTIDEKSLTDDYVFVKNTEVDAVPMR